MAVDSAAAARRIATRQERRRQALHARSQSAQRDAARIIAAIAAECRPRRIYQWGSLVHTERFTDMSDIDIAVEGMSCNEHAFAAMHARAERMTDFPVDLVVLERVEPGRANLIRRFGRVEWQAGTDA